MQLNTKSLAVRPVWPILRMLLFAVFFFFCFFPYITLVPTSTDLQPYAFVASLLICILVPRKLPLEIWLLAITPCAAFVIWLLVDRSYFGFREVLTFLSLLTITAATFIVLESVRGAAMLRRYLVFASYSWLFVGVIEWVFYPELVAPLIPNISLDSTRGVTGLATEPSFYGSYCLGLLGLNYLCNNNDKRIIGVLLFQIVVLAKSAVTILMLLLFAILRALFFPSFRVLAAVIIVTLAVSWLLTEVFPQFQDLRVIYLASSLLDEPMAVLDADASLNARIGHSVFSILGFVDNYAMPRGFDHFHEYVSNEANSAEYVWLGATEPGLKIMSGYGSALFELGVFGIFIPIAVSFCIVKYFRSRWRMAFLMVLYVTTIMFSAIQLSSPPLGVLLGWMLAASRQRWVPQQAVQIHGSSHPC